MMDEKSAALSAALISLLKGVVNRETNTKQWNAIVIGQTQIEDYVAKIGLILILDETDGYAYLKQQTQAEDHFEIPHIIPRYALSYPVSLLLVLLRRQLLEFDSKNGEQRFIVSKQEIIEMMCPYLKGTTNEAKQIKEIELQIKRIKEMGFVRLMDESTEDYEVLRILRSFVDAQWLGEMNERLQAYQIYAQGHQQEDTNNESI